ncbi:MAG: DUF444 family protein [Candidatus Eisenbacteria bacterium]|nr:DUF444 family protein [Candidatus Latescibacterota bacterium]MBD3301697.1 DUF444 family protein [Candidatus Eisenbacteria bacterium]
MLLRIDRDHNRFKEIVKGRIKRDFRKYITREELVGRRGDRLVSIPVPQIELPRFRHGKNQAQGVGQGSGKEGDPADGAQGEGVGTAGDQPGRHMLEVEISYDELAQILGEELELPDIRPKGSKHTHQTKDRYTGIRATGPESLRHVKRTYKKALKRQIASGTYDPDNPIIIPIKEDKLYRSWKPSREPRANAAVFYLMDVSGSMGDEQKEIVRIESFWIDTWLRYQYRDVEFRYIVHDAVAHEVDRQTFFHLKESGGTKISSAYDLLGKILGEEYPAVDWNLYVFQFSDGDNWGSGDTERCLELLDEEFLPVVNLFAYGQVESPYGSGQFLKDVGSRFGESENLILSEIQDKDKVYDSIKEFLGKGR